MNSNALRSKLKTERTDQPCPWDCELAASSVGPARSGEAVLQSKPADIKGHVESFDTSDPNGQYIVGITETPVPSVLGGRYIVIANDGQQDGVYKIARVEQKNRQVHIFLGGASLVRGFVDHSDYTKGFIYNIKKGDSFVIPVSKYWQQPLR